MLLLGGVLIALVPVEIALRLTTFLKQRDGGDLQSRLEESGRASLQDASGEFSLKGLVKASARTGTVYELKTDLRGTFLGKSLETNSHGFRGAEIPKEKPERVFRIAGLGDSVMFGWGVNQNECYLQVLERSLVGLERESGRFEVLNFAAPGYNTAMEVDVLEHVAMQFDPNLVILHVISNDVDVPLFMQKTQSLRTLKHCFLWDLIRDRAGWAPRHESGNALDQYSYMTGIEGFRSAVERLARISQRAGIPVLVIRGSLSPIQERVVRDYCREFGFHEIPVARYTDAYVRKHGIEDTPQARRRALHVSENDRHPNAAAHTIYAEAILDQLASMEIIDFESNLKPE
jgi:lysophospholipase L1-like esterase